MSIRVYPIRMTRKEWHIGLYTVHSCIRGCNHQLIKDRRRKKYKCTIRQVSQNSSCTRKNNIENTIVSINDFDIRNPCGIFGELHLANNIVIPHTEFTMILQYPFSTKLKITVNDPLGNGFTLKEVLYAIKLSYQDIYETEERTSSNHMYILIRECTKCNIINVKRRIKENQSSNGLVDLILNHDNHDNHDSHECSICKDYLVDNSSSLSTTDGGGIIKLRGCGHIFHENCIDRWIESNGKT